jgi:hypothetical protein
MTTLQRSASISVAPIADALRSATHHGSARSSRRSIGFKPENSPAASSAMGTSARRCGVTGASSALSSGCPYTLQAGAVSGLRLEHPP